MSLLVTGWSHHTSPLALRERLHFGAEALPKALLALREHLGGGGVVVLSTCNRVEVYVSHAGETGEAADDVRAFLADWHGMAPQELDANGYTHEGRKAVGHLFRVASSLDSLVMGEPQVLGQVREAYLVAEAEQTTDKILRTLFQKALKVAKEVRERTEIGAGTVSIASVAADLAVSIFGDLAAKTALVVGSGEMGELTLKGLVTRGIGHTLLTNRSPEKAEELAASYGGEQVVFSDLARELHRADIIITSTGASEYVLKPSDFQNALAVRGQEPMFVIDIAVPRNVDPAVNELDNVYVYSVDDLQEVAERNMEARRDELEKCIQIVNRGADQLMQWLQGLAAEPTIITLAEELNALRERELQKTLRALPDLSDAQRGEVEYLTKRIVNAILHHPMSQLKREVGHHDPNVVLHLAKRLFGIGDKP